MGLFGIILAAIWANDAWQQLAADDSIESFIMWLFWAIFLAVQCHLYEREHRQKGK